MQNNEYYTQNNTDNEVQQQQVDLGTFKSVKTLKEAYDCLRKAFTQNSMELAKLKKEESVKQSLNSSLEDETELQNEEKSAKNVEKNANFEENEAILEKNVNITTSDKEENSPDKNGMVEVKAGAPETNKFEGEEWSEYVQEFFSLNPEARDCASDIGRIIMHDKAIQNSENPLDKAWIKILLERRNSASIDDAKLEEYALKNDSIKQKIIAQYLLSLQHKKSAPRVISERVGSQVNITKTPRILSMADAKEMAKKILIK